MRQSRIDTAVERAKRISGWMRESELRWLATRAIDLDLVVEFGSWHGRSTMALLLAEQVVCCDSWATEHGLKWDEDHVAEGLPFSCFIQNHLAAFMNGKLIPMVVDLSHPDYREALAREFAESKADMVFVDADHSYIGVKRDIELAKRIVKPGGIICGHDFGEKDWPGVEKAVMEIFGKGVSNPAGSIWVVEEN